MEQKQPTDYDSKKTDILLELSQESEILKNHFLKRREKGINTYGTPLQPFNGRDAKQDLIEELLDACTYARQLFFEIPCPENLKLSLILLQFSENIHNYLYSNEGEIK